jgi:hypothetical protein
MGVNECPHCGARVRVPDDARVRIGHNESSGEKGREWVMRDRGIEIHRCPDTNALPGRKAGVRASTLCPACGVRVDHASDYAIRAIQTQDEAGATHTRLIANEALVVHACSNEKTDNQGTA